MRLRRAIKWILIPIMLLVAAAFLLPIKHFIESQLVLAFEGKGFTPTHLTLDHVGTHGLALKDVSLGDPPLMLTSLTVGFQPRALLQGRIEDLELSGLQIHAAQHNGAWAIDGLGDLLKSKGDAKPAAIPVTHDALSILPLRSLKVSDGSIEARGEGLLALLPVTLELHNDTAATFAFDSKEATLDMGENALAIGALSANLALDEAKQQWSGTWKMEDIALTSESLALPKLKAAGTVTLLKDVVKLEGAITSDDKSYTASFTLDYALNDPAKSVIVLKQLRMPFSGGTIATSNVRYALSGKPHAIAATLALNKIPLDQLMNMLTSNRATATGVVSGTVPLTVTADGKIRIGTGALKAEAPGQITLSPDIIPGDNPQVALVREVMKDLQYKLLALEFAGGEGNALNVKLSVEGSNPTVQQGRAVKLTVNLSGDLLDLILQNVTLMTDPKTFIEQNRHEKD